MKKALFNSLIVTLFTTILSGVGNAQTASTSTQTGFENSNFDPGQLTDAATINVKASKHFTKKYKDVANPKWFISSSRMWVAHFINDNVETFVYYNLKGTFEFMVRNYKEDKLPQDIRYLIKSNYYDFAIYHITEISRNGKVAYGINLKNKAAWKTIKVVDGEMELIAEYTEPQK